MRRLARPALAWSLVNTLVGRVGSVLLGIAMARILVPDDYGVYAVAVVVLNAALSLNELGVSLAVVRWPGDPRGVAASVNTIALLGSVTLYALGFAFAPSIASALSAPDATPVLRVLLLAAVVDGVTSVPAALLTRAFRQRARTFIDLVGLAVTGAVGLSMAVGGYGAWSLAIGQLLGSVVSAVAILVVTRPYPGLEVRWTLWKELIRFGAPLAAASALVFAMLNADYVVVGNRLGSEALGVYFLAFGLASFPVTLVSQTIRRVALPAFARLAEDRDRLAGSVLDSLRMLLAITVPGCVALALLAPPLVDVLYGDKWAAAASALAPLAGLAAIRIVTELLYDLHVAMGWTGRVFLVQLAWLAALVPAMVVGATRDGIEGVGIAHVVVGATVGLPLFTLALGRVGIHAADLVRTAGPSIMAGGITALVVLGLDSLIASPALLLATALPACVVLSALAQRRTLLPIVHSYRRDAAAGGT